MNAMEITEYDCSVEITLRLIGGKWKILILWELMLEPVLRCGELHRRIPGVTTKVLVQQLRELEGDRLIERKVYPVVPSRVEYRLTPFGETFRPVMKSMCDWGDAYRSHRAPAGEPALAVIQSSTLQP
jgi:DNA-binding HxlR family transcriptional regulator